MSLDICEVKKIKLMHSITFNDIKKIRIKLNSPKSVGNEIDLPLTDDWKTIMSSNPLYNKSNNVKFHNLRRIIFYFSSDIDNIIVNREITTFSTDYTINSASVLTYEDINNIYNAVDDIINEKKNQLFDTLIDPVTLDLLVYLIIASDGITYSRATLKKLFEDNKNPISPVTREPLICVDNKYGVKNILIKQIIELFF
jgi:hypothetical protein